MPSLQAFAQAAECVLVVTQPDRPAGRGHRLRPTPVKSAANQLGIVTLEPARVRDAFDALRAARADVFGVASYGKILPQAALDLPSLGALNVHPSLLPLYRGATPLQSQLRDGVSESGVTIILMDAGMDTGDIVLQERSPIGASETYGKLHDRFAALGARLLAQACIAAATGTLVRTPQAGLASDDEIARTLTRPLTKQDLRLDRLGSAKCSVDLVRALAPQPLARLTIVDDEEVKVAAAHVAREDEQERLEGTMLSSAWTAPEALPEAICSRREDGLLVIDRVVPPNRAPMSAGAYFRSATTRLAGR